MVDLVPLIIEQHRSSREEIIARLGFERRMIAVQIVIFAGVIAAPTYENQFQIEATIGFLISSIFVFIGVLFMRHGAVNTLEIWTQSYCISIWLNRICYQHTNCRFLFPEGYFHQRSRRASIDPFKFLSVDPSSMLAHLIILFGFISSIYYLQQLYVNNFFLNMQTQDLFLTVMSGIFFIFCFFLYISVSVDSLRVNRFIKHSFKEEFLLNAQRLNNLEEMYLKN